ncbi:MAG: hypothetical protein OEV20_01065, partial [Actinomycetota bacterium]|nr:hypothetical protein [Actinomycetota bacterium]
QPSHPWTAGASHLYTREFFELVSDHLEPGGVFVQWMGLAFIDEELLAVLVATLQDVFPHVTVHQPQPAGVVFFASHAPLDLERTDPPPSRAHRRHTRPWACAARSISRRTSCSTRRERGVSPRGAR